MSWRLAGTRIFIIYFILKRVALETETAEDCFNNKAIYTMKTLFFFSLSFFPLCLF